MKLWLKKQLNEWGIAFKKAIIFIAFMFFAGAFFSLGWISTHAKFAPKMYKSTIINVTEDDVKAIVGKDGFK